MKLIDISHILDNKTPIYPGDYQTSLSSFKTIEHDYYNSVLLKTGLHTGTHIDMPMHLIDDKRTAADFPAERFIGKGTLLNVCGEAVITMKPKYEKIVSKGSIVLLYTGFDKFYFDEKYFSEYPAVSDELASFLISKKIKILGMDMPAPDYAPFTLHKELLANDIFLLENLTNLDKLIGAVEIEVISFPLKISAEASPVRAVCRIID